MIVGDVTTSGVAHVYRSKGGLLQPGVVDIFRRRVVDDMCICSTSRMVSVDPLRPFSTFLYEYINIDGGEQCLWMLHDNNKLHASVLQPASTTVLIDYYHCPYKLRNAVLLFLLFSGVPRVSYDMIVVLQPTKVHSSFAKTEAHNK